MNADKLLASDDIKLLLLCFFNVTDDLDGKFLVKSSFRESKFGDGTNDFDKDDINSSLNQYFNAGFVSPVVGEHVFEITKTASIQTVDNLVEALYSRVQILAQNVDSKLYDEYVAAALFVPRGSVDFTAQYYAVDIYRRFSTSTYMRRVLQILSGTRFISVLNLNFRELQPQYLHGQSMRNTQIRIRLGWLWREYAGVLRAVNAYKYEILRVNQDRIADVRDYTGNFAERLIEYSMNILGTDVRDEDVEMRRKQLGLAVKSSSDVRRNYSIVSLAIEILPDECSGCKGLYDLSTRTFRLRSSNRYYLEIHHVIPFSQGREHDQIDNLVKLCPVCHRIMTRGRAEEVLQRQIIGNMLKNAGNAWEYVSVLANTSDNDAIIDYTYAKLA